MLFSLTALFLNSLKRDGAERQPAHFEWLNVNATTAPRFVQRTSLIYILAISPSANM
jgi:hypothetical protein